MIVVAVGILALFGSNVACAFSPLASVTVPTTIRRASANFFFATTQEKTETIELTDQDAEVLFGEAVAMKRGPSEPDDNIVDPLAKKLRNMREEMTICPQVWEEVAELCPDRRALVDEHNCDTKVHLTFSQMSALVDRCASVFQGLGVKKGVNVAVLGENSAQWLLVDHGIQLAGGASAVRGADAPVEELRYIYNHSDSAGIVVLQGPRLLNKLAQDAAAQNLKGLGLENKKYGPVKTVVLMHKEGANEMELIGMSKDLGIELIFLMDAVNKAERLVDRPKIGLNDLSTIVYTSGTTGQPKGVMLTHGNLLHQISHRLAPSMPFEACEPNPGDTMLSLLPVWHITERTFELWMLTRGCSVVYSSIRYFRSDLSAFRPEWLVLVPRVLETIAKGAQDKMAEKGRVASALVKFFSVVGAAHAFHAKQSKGITVGDEAPTRRRRQRSAILAAALSPLTRLGNKLIWKKVQDGFGGNVKLIISGGSALAESLETFFEIAGMKILVGYGLTECSPLLTYRRSDTNMVAGGAAGHPAAFTEVRIVDPDIPAGDTERPALPDGQAGLIIGRGPQVMKGYYKNPKATIQAVDRFGWFDTGDLGRINPATGDLFLTGRAKDTIVLSNGENIEPFPIEEAILSASSLMEQVMLAGQDGRRLVAITVMNPVALANAGFVSDEQAIRLKDLMATVNDPKCTKEDSKAACDELAAASQELRQDKALTKTLVQDTKKATRVFRDYERVGTVHMTLEPFAMSNGMLTQSYKVKRGAVTDRFGPELPE